MKSMLLVCVVLLTACASNRPVLYSASGTPAGGEAAIADCHQRAIAAGATPEGGRVGETANQTVRGAALGGATGAVGGAIAGAAGRGAGIGAASGATAALISAIFAPNAPNPAYRAYVERCLQDQGFDTVGWR